MIPMKIYLVSRCVEKIKDGPYVFKVNCPLMGIYVSQAILEYKKMGICVGEDYLLFLKVQIKGTKIYGNVITAKKLKSIRRDFF